MFWNARMPDKAGLYRPIFNNTGNRYRVVEIAESKSIAMNWCNKKIRSNPWLLPLVAITFPSMLLCGDEREPIPFRVADKMPDRMELLSPAAVHLDGFLGLRAANNEKNRLVKIDLEPLLAGFRKKPGSHPWIGEHIGKWLHASTLAWAYTGDPELRAKMDGAVAELVKAQEPDGYLGTYTPDKRFGLYQGADWDVWSHKYNLMGLLTYYHYTGNSPALAVSRKMGDLLMATFGPGKKSILAAGTHIGMAATSVLEPMVLLYRHTGESRYLDFARYIVQSWDEPKGPKIIAALMQSKAVNKTANGKAYEMLSNLVGLCELARVTGDRQLLQPVINAWEDIVAHRLYLTGSASQGEHFGADYYLPNQSGANVSETCVTTTWIQLTSQLLRLTGEARFGDQLERTFYNHLAAAQRPDGAQWCYFTALEGTKPYGPGINCCVSSGPRGMALVPPHAYLKFSGQGIEPDSLAVNLFEASQIHAVLGGQSVTLEQQTDFPQSGNLTLIIHASQPARFGLRVRAPAWAAPVKLQIGSVGNPGDSLKDGWLIVPARQWREGDRVQISLNLIARRIEGDHTNIGKSALVWGPLVLAYDTHRNESLPSPGLLGLVSEPNQPAFKLKTFAGLPVFEAKVQSARATGAQAATFVAFAEAGSDGGRYQVWLRSPGVELPKNDSLFAFSQESRSQQGNVAGSICDGDRETFVVTYNTRPQKEAWFAVSLDEPVQISRVIFAHGKAFHDGGWFDTSAGKPRLEARSEKGGRWEPLGTLDDYPSLTATDSRNLQAGQIFTVQLKGPQKVVALRIVGKPACGDNPQQAFASCAELQGLP